MPYPRKMSCSYQISVGGLKGRDDLEDWSENWSVVKLIQYSIQDVILMTGWVTISFLKMFSLTGFILSYWMISFTYRSVLFHSKAMLESVLTFNLYFGAFISR
jgi:hypothetical protein